MTEYFCEMRGLGSRIRRIWFQKDQTSEERIHLIVDHLWVSTDAILSVVTPFELAMEAWEVKTLWTKDKDEKKILFKWPKNYYNMNREEYAAAMEKLHRALEALPATVTGAKPVAS